MTESSVIGQTTVIRGNVRGDGAIELLGSVEGDVSATGDVSLAESAAVHGNLTGAAVRVAGTVNGNLTGSESVSLAETARVVGDLRAPRIGIAEGALVRGTVQTEEPRTTAPTPRATAAGAAEHERARPAPPRAVARIQPAAAAAPKPAPKAAPKAAAKAARQPPAPVVPALAKGTRGRKKKARSKR
jgi:cytoskeletal protein CcmA (bactofilin family)